MRNAPVLGAAPSLSALRDMHDIVGDMDGSSIVHILKVFHDSCLPDSQCCILLVRLLSKRLRDAQANYLGRTWPSCERCELLLDKLDKLTPERVQWLEKNPVERLTSVLKVADDPFDAAAQLARKRRRE